jgi:hypothetical protein
MSSPLTLRAALARGAVVTLANWPVILIDFVVESAYKFTLGVPVVASAFMVAVLLGVDIRTLLGDGLLSAADQMLVPLTRAPAALAAFLGALSVVGVFGAALMFVVKAGTLAILVSGERAADDVHRRPLTMESLKGVSRYSLSTVLAASRRFQHRSVRLALGLGIGYVVLGGVYLFVVVDGFWWVAESRWAPVWPLLMFVATSGAAVGMTALNLFFDLARVIMIADDCQVRVALDRGRAFLLADARQVLGIFGAMGGIVLLATVAGFTATAALALIAWVPIVGVIFVPMQVAFWLLRGLLFQYVSLTTLSAYQSQYRRFSSPSPAPVRLRVHEA